MADLVSIEELRNYLRMPNLDADNAAPVIAGVSAQVRRYTRRAWTATAETIRVDGTGSRSLLLPRLPVTALTTITEDPDAVTLYAALVLDATDYEWNADGVVRRIDGGVFYRRLRYYEIEYEHGEGAPDDVKLVVLRVCARGTVNPEGLVQETTAGYSAAFGQDATRLAVLSDADRRELHEYRVTV